MRMICRCFGKTLDLGVIRQTAQLMLGVPDYENYVAHVTAVHPERAPLSREAFFRERQAARYGSVLRCC
jgi:uncharacterized short protein YbdD (DUF466 family)